MNGVVVRVVFNRGRAAHAVATVEALTGKPQRQRLRRRDDGTGRILGRDKFFFSQPRAGNFVLADHPIGSPVHLLRDRMAMRLAVNQDGSVQNTRVLVELPPREVVTGSGIFVPCLLYTSDAADE